MLRVRRKWERNIEHLFESEPYKITQGTTDRWSLSFPPAHRIQGGFPKQNPANEVPAYLLPIPENKQVHPFYVGRVC